MSLRTQPSRAESDESRICSWSGSDDGEDVEEGESAEVWDGEGDSFQSARANEQQLVSSERKIKEGMKEPNSPNTKPRSIHRRPNRENNPVALLPSCLNPSSFNILSRERISFDDLDSSGSDVREESVGFGKISSKEKGEGDVGRGRGGEDESSEVMADVSRGTEEEELHLVMRD